MSSLGPDPTVLQQSCEGLQNTLLIPAGFRQMRPLWTHAVWFRRICGIAL